GRGKADEGRAGEAARGGEQCGDHVRAAGERRGGDGAARADRAVQVRDPADASRDVPVDAVDGGGLEGERGAGRGAGAVERLRDRDARRRVADADGDRLGGREAVAVGHRGGDDVAAAGEARRGDRRARAERAGDAGGPLDRRRAVAVLEV